MVKAAVMGIVEGLTEFLPISSTGHLILTASLIDFTGEVAKVFEIAIQTGAMFAVVWQYRAGKGSALVFDARVPCASPRVKRAFCGKVNCARTGYLPARTHE